MTKSETKPVANLKYEQALAELEALVAALESGEKTLDESMALFERGQALIQHCAKLLEKAELKVRTLTGEATGEGREG